MRSTRLYRFIKAACAGALLPLWMAASTGSASPQQAELPEGTGRDVATRACVVCHGPEPIFQQHLARRGWQNEVEKMIRWGAEVDAKEKDQLIDYFAAHFAAKRTVPPKQDVGDFPEGPGVAIARDSCVVCHGAEPILQQRLSRAKWTGEVDKMIRWGADVPADRKAALIDYLVEHFPDAR